MNEKRIKEIEQSFEKLPDFLHDQFLCVSSIPELIAALRDAQKPLAEVLGPTIGTIRRARNCPACELFNDELDKELTRLRQLLPDNEKGQNEPD